MKYEKEILDFIHSMYDDDDDDDWMDENDKKEIEAEMMKFFLSMEPQLTKDIDIGISNGYSAKQQLEIAIKMYKALK